jgi:hypothetical protein
MASLNDLTLKGYFQSLKEEVNRKYKHNEHARLLHLLEKAVGLIEEAYEKDFNLLHPDNAIDYKEMIEALNEYGVKYNGNKEILELAVKQIMPESEGKRTQMKTQTEKLPMKKASGMKNAPSEQLKKRSG